MKNMAQRGVRSMFRRTNFRAVVRSLGSRTVAARFASSLPESYEYRTYDNFPVHGGELKERMITDEAQKTAAINEATHTVVMNDRQMCDVELLMTGAFSPLEGFMNEDVYNHCVDTYRLPESNLIFGIPVVLDTDDENVQPGDTILLKSKAGEDVAVMEVEDKFTPNKPKECKEVYGTSSIEHPGTLMVATERGKYYLGGKVHGLNIPARPFPCKTPAEVFFNFAEERTSCITLNQNVPLTLRSVRSFPPRMANTLLCSSAATQFTAPTTNCSCALVRYG